MSHSLLPDGSIRSTTVLVADIAGFTGFSGRLGDRIVLPFGAYFDCMSREIHAQNGTIDEFTGDAVMAFWGAPDPDPDHAIDACRAALTCQRAIRVSGLADDSGHALRVRIGINSGSIFVGNIGSRGRLNYMVIGDTVKVAGRLESANKEYGTQIMIAEETRRLACDRVQVRELDSLAVYGRTSGLRIYELLGIAGEGTPEPNWVTLYEAGLTAYRERKFAAAIGFFQMLLVVRERDGASRAMIERCRRLIQAPPGKDWNATTAMDAK